jgi:hypothetical protein
MKAIKLWIKNEYLDLVESIKFWRAKRLANLLHKKHGKRYHVVALGESELVVIDNDGNTSDGRRITRSDGKKIPFYDLIKKSYYSTSVNSPVLRERAIPKKK